MKKKILSLVVMVAVLVTMLSTTVFAADQPTTAKQVKDRMQAAADWEAGQIVDAIGPKPNASQVVDYYAYQMFLIERTGTKTDNVAALENVFLGSLEENINAHNGEIVGNNGDARYDIYCNVIAALKAMGKDPTNFLGYDIVGALAKFIESGAPIIRYGGSPYNLVTIGAVLDYYKGYDDALKNEYDCLDAAIIKTYVKDTYASEKMISEDDIRGYDTDNVLSNYVSGTDYVIEYGSYKINNSAIIDALNASQSYYAGKFSINQWGYLAVVENFKGPGFFNYIMSIDNDAKMIVGLLNSTATSEFGTLDSQSVTINEVKNTMITKISDAIGDSGLISVAGFTDNADTTGLALAGMSAYGKAAEATALYTGLVTLQNEDGGFGWTTGSDSDTYSTKDAIEGLTAYYFMLGDLGSIFDLSVYPEATAETNEVEMTTPENTTWTAGSGEWFTFSSPLPLSELIDIQIDGKSVFGDYISTDENGVMTFAAVGGGVILVWEGSTYVSFSPEFMATLPAGDHTVRIQSTTGFAEATFTTAAAPVTPATGDSANTALYVTIMAAGLAAVAVAVAKKKSSVND